MLQPTCSSLSCWPSSACPMWLARTRTSSDTEEELICPKRAQDTEEEEQPGMLSFYLRTPHVESCRYLIHTIKYNIPFNLSGLGTDHLPIVDSKSQTFRIPVGEGVVLPCQVQYLGERISNFAACRRPTTRFAPFPSSSKFEKGYSLLIT